MQLLYLGFKSHTETPGESSNLSFMNIIGEQMMIDVERERTVQEVTRDEPLHINTEYNKGIASIV